jgi:hypothetical protein
MTSPPINKKKVKIIDSSVDIQRYYSDNRITRSRLVLTDEQKTLLENYFQLHPHPSQPSRDRLSDRLGIPLKNINIWFQNRRAKEKRDDEEK